jgi:hypothetical protein
VQVQKKLPRAEDLYRGALVDDNSVAFKVDMSNAFNAVPRQAVVDECATFSPEIVMVLWVTSSVMAPSRTNQFRVRGLTGRSLVPCSLQWSCRN